VLVVKRIVGIGALLIALLLGGIFFYGVHTVRASFPQSSGEIELAGLDNLVQVKRDDLGVPNIYAENIEDLFFAQGYVHAQDRFWEMDVRRHITAGRLSEMFGESQVETDSFLRTLGWRKIAEQELTLLSEKSHQILDSYSAGVNAYLADHQGSEVSLEYAVLGLQNPDYTIEDWVPADSVAWLKALAWDLRGNMEDEIYRAIMSASVGVAQTEKLYPDYPFAQHRPIVEIGAVVDGVFDQNATTNSGGPSIGTRYSAPQIAALEKVSTRSASLGDWLGKSGDGIGSNSWVVGGEKTKSGMPILANDPHLAPAMPSLWYQAGLRCVEVSQECNYDVAGWTMAGLPGVFIGHNNNIAWGFTNLGSDVTDLVLHKISGNTYLLDGKQVELTTRSETINVVGGDPIEITVRGTVDGPLISDIAGIDTYNQVGADAPLPAPDYAASDVSPPVRGESYAVALRWTALTPRNTFDAFDELNTAQNWGEFQAAAKLLSVPAQNLIYADKQGVIGYQAPGTIPIRSGYDGKWPVPGWTSQYQWQGFIPFEALPTVTNPPENWIVTANQPVIGPNYEYFLTDDWSYGSRSQRIVDLIETFTAGGAALTPERMRAIQMDSHNDLAAFMIPRLASVPIPQEVRDAAALFSDWDFTQPTQSAPAAYFNAIWKQMVVRMFDAAAKSDSITTSGGDQFWEVIKNIWDSPDDFWWDDKTTPVIESRDQLLATAMVAARGELANLQGSAPDGWNWGGLHTLTLTNQTLGTSGIGPVERIFNRGPIEVSGGDSIVNATGWTPSDGYEVSWVPSMRQVIDLADFDNSTWVNLTGNSGHAYNSNYSNQIDAWRDGAQFDWAFSSEAVQKATVDTLTLKPVTN
jgi:penicillin amidase